MNKLKTFQQDFDCNERLIKVGDEYKVFDIERDPFYCQLSNEYRKYLDYQSYNTQELSRRCLEMLESVTDYFVGEYTETTDEEFQDIFKKFFERWYWDDIYVCYSEEVLEKEVESWENRLDINRDECKADNPYRLFKLVSRVDKDKHIYSSIYTGLTYEIDTSVIPMVWASANKGRNWREWTFILREFIAAEQLFLNTQKLAGKRIMREVRNNDSIHGENESLKCIDVLFNIDNRDIVSKNKYEPFDACAPDIPKGIWDNLLNWFMTKTGWLGYVQNMNDKKERLTTGENFKDLHSITNIQYRNLKDLNAFGRLFAKKYPGKELNFNLSNWGEAEGVPEGEFGGEEIDNIEDNSENNDETQH